MYSAIKKRRYILHVSSGQKNWLLEEKNDAYSAFMLYEKKKKLNIVSRLELGNLRN